MAKKIVYIKVFVTKDCKFRADIKEIDMAGGNHMESVTVGSDSWHQGKCVDHHDRILKKCRILLEYLENQLNEGK